jgi:hypothetical protein
MYAATARVAAKLLSRGSITEFANTHPVPVSGGKTFNAKSCLLLQFEVRINSLLLPLSAVTHEF